MSDSQQKYTGTRYTSAAGLLIMAFIFSPAVLIVSHPFEYATLSLALASSGLCVTLAWINWRRHLEVTIPSIAPQYSRGNDTR